MCFTCYKITTLNHAPLTYRLLKLNYELIFSKVRYCRNLRTRIKKNVTHSETDLYKDAIFDIDVQVTKSIFIYKAFHILQKYC